MVSFNKFSTHKNSNVIENRIMCQNDETFCVILKVWGQTLCYKMRHSTEDATLNAEIFV